MTAILKPHARLADLHAREGIYVPVLPDSPQWLRTRIYRMAVQFRREIRIDFSPCNDRKDSGHRGHIITDAEGRALGAFGVRWRDYRDTPGWMMTWAWIAPPYRRQGLLRQAWEMAVQTYPGIDPEPPFSCAAANFFATRNDITDEMRKIAALHAERGGLFFEREAQGR
jgi:hypothetical protein